jgi:hypothetical protein
LAKVLPSQSLAIPPHQTLPSEGRYGVLFEESHRRISFVGIKKCVYNEPGSSQTNTISDDKDQNSKTEQRS